MELKPFNPKKGINDVDDYTDYANEMFEAYLETFTKEDGLIRDLQEGDILSDGEYEDTEFVYTRKGDRLAEKMQRKLYEIGEAHFPDKFIEIKTNLYRN